MKPETSEKLSDNETHELNVLIHKFMGSPWPDVNPSRYDAYWDCVMPAWIKFRDIAYDSLDKYEGWLDSLQYYLVTSDEPKRFAQRLGYAIKWFNSQPQL